MEFDYESIELPDPADFVPDRIRDAWRVFSLDADEQDAIERVMEWLVYGDFTEEQGDESTPSERYRDLAVWRGRSNHNWWVNTYITHDEYGGPEEGGWWYTVHEPDPQMVPGGPYMYGLEGYRAACAAAYGLNNLHRRMEENRKYSIVERHRARTYPMHKPHYC